MNQRVIRAAKKKLLDRQQLLTRLHQGVREQEEMVSGPTDPADSADLAAGQKAVDILQSLSAVELRELRAVQAALRRLEDGTYGECLSCGGEIGEGRLKAIPEAALCVDCAAMREKSALGVLPG